MVFGSVCSGIEAASCAWKPLGWRAEFVADIDKFPCAVLKHYHPEVPNHGDMNRFKEWPDARIDVLVGGTPCQSFSVAGLRKGLDDPRGNLTLVYLAVAAKYRPEWLVWENVPGVLSDDEGRSFGAFLGGLAQLGYGFAYRVLDAQFFRVAQQRRRVFVVASARGWASAGAVLSERESVSWNPPPSREAWEVAAGTLTGGAALGGMGPGGRTDSAGTGYLQVEAPEIARCIATREGTSQDWETTMVAHSLRGEGFDASEDGTGRGTPLVPIVAPTLTSNGDAHSGFKDERGLVPVGFAQNQRDEVRMMDVAGALASEPGMKQQTYLHQAMRVRRLTPRECERLQGFEDDYTLIPYNGKPAKDGPRYKALGNSMAVPVMAWIGRRIQMVSELETQ